MSDQHNLSSDLLSKCVGNVEQNDSDSRRLRRTRVGILCVHDGVNPDPDLAGLNEFGDTRVRSLLCVGIVRQHSGECNGKKHVFHVPSTVSAHCA